MTTWDWGQDFDTRLTESSEVHALLDFAGAIVERGAVARAPVSDVDDGDGSPPGHLKRSIHRAHGRDTLGGYVDVIADAKTPDGDEYGLAVELGVGPHTRTSPSGQRYQHPGTPAQPFLRPALDDLRAAM